MLKTLLAVDGSTAALRAVEYAIKLACGCPSLELLLLNVQPPVDAWEVKRFLPESEVQAMQVSRGGDALAAARQMLDAAGVAYSPDVAMGPVAETLAAYATSHGCDGILMGNKGESLLQEIVIGSVAHDVLRLSALPVTFIK